MTNNYTSKFLNETAGQVPGNLPPKHLHVIMAKASKGKEQILNGGLPVGNIHVIGARASKGKWFISRDIKLYLNNKDIS